MTTLAFVLICAGCFAAGVLLASLLSMARCNDCSVRLQQELDCARWAAHDVTDDVRNQRNERN